MYWLKISQISRFSALFSLKFALFAQNYTSRASKFRPFALRQYLSSANSANSTVSFRVNILTKNVKTNHFCFTNDVLGDWGTILPQAIVPPFCPLDFHFRQDGNSFQKIPFFSRFSPILAKYFFLVLLRGDLMPMNRKKSPRARIPTSRNGCFRGRLRNMNTNFFLFALSKCLCWRNIWIFLHKISHS